MTIDEAIVHAREKSKEQRYYSNFEKRGSMVQSCLKCAEEHEQLAEWLEELKDCRDKTNLERYQMARGNFRVDDRICVFCGYDAMRDNKMHLPYMVGKGANKVYLCKKCADKTDDAVKNPHTDYENKQSVECGEWLYSPQENISICSCCRYEHYLGTYHQYATKYCPNCGQKMKQIN